MKEEDAHRSRERRAFHSLDDKLREHGFRIQARRGNDEARWTRGGEVYLQEEALRICETEGWQ